MKDNLGTEMLFGGTDEYNSVDGLSRVVDWLVELDLDFCRVFVSH